MLSQNPVFIYSASVRITKIFSEADKQASQARETNGENHAFTIMQVDCMTNCGNVYAAQAGVVAMMSLLLLAPTSAFVTPALRLAGAPARVHLSHMAPSITISMQSNSEEKGRAPLLSLSSKLLQQVHLDRKQLYTNCTTFNI